MFAFSGYSVLKFVVSVFALIIEGDYILRYLS